MKKYLLKYSILWIYFQHSSFAVLSTQTVIKGSNVELKCEYRSTENSILWMKETTGLSEGTIIYGHVVPDEFRQRLSITGNHVDGEYHLTIANVEKTDEGIYLCITGTPPNISHVQLSVIVGPTSTIIDTKTQHNKLVGTERQDLNISCRAVGGDPPPDMVLQVKHKNYTTNSQGFIRKTLMEVDKTYDGATVMCLAGYKSHLYFKVTDNATIHLRLKPFKPQFRPFPIVTEETELLSVTCTSSGGRPAATERQWTICDTDVTRHSSTVTSAHNPLTDTYTVTSNLKYNVDRNYNGKTLSCGFRNEATEGFISGNITMNIKFAPSVSVENKSFIPSDTIRQIECVANGNPESYSFSKWQHKSNYGTLIRTLDGNSTLTLPQLSEEARYQDAGEYICTVSNGFKDKDGNAIQQASGYVGSQTLPVFLNGDQQIKLGQTKSDVKIHVNVYSVPKYTSLQWLKGSKLMSSESSNKYTMSDAPTVVTDMFHGTEILVDGYRLTLTIHNLEEQDFVNYTLRLMNVVSLHQTVEHLVILLSASPPEIPTNFTQIGATESTITLQWLPAYDGGHEQAFIVEYRTSGSSKWEKAYVPNTLYMSKDDLQTYTLSGLIDGTAYEIRVLAENKFNQSNTTDIVTVSTIDGSGQGAVIGAIVGVLIFIVVTVVIVTVVIIRRKGAMNNKSASEEYANQSEYANGGQPTGGYKNADGLQYADIIFSNQPKTNTGKDVIHGLDERTIYCDVDLTKKAPPPPQEGAYELTEISQAKKS